MFHVGYLYVSFVKKWSKPSTKFLQVLSTRFVSNSLIMINNQLQQYASFNKSSIDHNFLKDTHLGESIT